MTNQKIKNRLEYLRGEIQAERISYGEIAELQGLAGYIDKDDVELLQWAGVPEDNGEKLTNAHYHFQQFQSLLTLEQVKKNRRSIISIEKSIFKK